MTWTYAIAQLLLGIVVGLNIHMALSKRRLRKRAAHNLSRIDLVMKEHRKQVDQLREAGRWHP